MPVKKGKREEALVSRGNAIGERGRGGSEDGRKNIKKGGKEDHRERKEEYQERKEGKTEGKGGRKKEKEGGRPGCKCTTITYDHIHLLFKSHFENFSPLLTNLHGQEDAQPPGSIALHR
jgi:hypothetical protein